jgi:hypothetical protein
VPVVPQVTNPCRVARLIHSSTSETRHVLGLIFTGAYTDAEDAWWTRERCILHVLLFCQPYAKSAVKPSNRNAIHLPTSSLHTVLFSCTLTSLHVFSARFHLCPRLPPPCRSCTVCRATDNGTKVRYAVLNVSSQRTRQRASPSASVTRPMSRSHVWPDIQMICNF